MGVGGTRLVVEFILLEDTRQEVGCTRVVLGDTHLGVESPLLEGIRVGVGATHLGVGCILREDIRPAVRCILLEVTRRAVGYFLLGPDLARDLEVLLRKRECPFIHLVVEVLVGLLGQARSILPVRASSLLEAVLREPAVVSILQGLVHQVLMDRVQADQGQTDQVQMDQARIARLPMVQVPMVQVPMVQVPMGQVLMDPGQMGQVQMGQVQTGQVRTGQTLMAQARMDPGRMDRMVLVPTDLARMDQVPMDLVRMGSLGLEATAKSQRLLPPRNMSAQLRLHLHHAPPHQHPSWQNAWKLGTRVMRLSLEDQIAHFAILARFALSLQRTPCKY